MDSGPRLVPVPANSWDEIYPDLYVGGLFRGNADTVRAVRVRDEFDLVVSLHQADWSRHGPDDMTRHWVRPIPDGELDEHDKTMLNDLTGPIITYVEHSRRVLVRCAAGVNRAPFVGALVLVRLGHTVAEALRIVKRHRTPDAVSNPYFTEYLREAAEKPAHWGRKR